MTPTAQALLHRRLWAVARAGCLTLVMGADLSPQGPRAGRGFAWHLHMHVIRGGALAEGPAGCRVDPQQHAFMVRGQFPEPEAERAGEAGWWDHWPSSVTQPTWGPHSLCLSSAFWPGLPRADLTRPEGAGPQGRGPQGLAHGWWAFHHIFLLLVQQQQKGP